VMIWSNSVKHSVIYLCELVYNYLLLILVVTVSDDSYVVL
jgi:hypothetical protein